MSHNSKKYCEALKKRHLRKRRLIRKANRWDYVTGTITDGSAMVLVEDSIDVGKGGHPQKCHSSM